MEVNHEEVVVRMLLLALTADFFVQFPARVSAGPAEDVQAAMQLLSRRLRRWVHPTSKGRRQSPADCPRLTFGATKMNNNFVLVDEVQKEVGGTATIFVKAATSSSAWQRTLRRMTGRGR